MSDWKGKVASLGSTHLGRAAYFVQLRGPGAVDAGQVAGRTVPGKVLSQRSVISSNADRVFASARGADARAVKLYTTTNLIPGFAVNTDAAGVEALASRSDVVKVSRIIPKTATNANTANLVHALNTWKFNGDTGKGVRIAVIDTGLDYTHADFGGKGTEAAYEKAFDNDTSASWRAQLPKLGKAKIIGGYDLAGDSYDANPGADTYQPIPHPDRNPLDCNEHGTHVAGIAAGYGVAKDGSTFTGKYSKLDADKLMKMRIGPGMAPEARLYSLRVFGCEGSTDLVLEALDRAMDPNQDGNTKDHFDMINLSVGSDDGVVDDPENAVVGQLAKHGVLPVISMGNGGDNTDIGGAPGNAPASLAVASSIDSFQMRDGLRVNAPGDVAGIAAGQFSVAYDWAHNGPTHAPVTGDVVTIPASGAFDAPSSTNNTDGCAALSPSEASAVAGKVAWLYWDDNDATRRCGSAGRAGNVAAAGAVGAIFTSDLDVFAAGITGSDVIPVIQLPKAQTDRLSPAVDHGLNVTFDGSLQATVKDITPAINDTLSSFSSRGTHGSLGVVKPDVTAPGDTIASAGMGTGDNVLVISGTSMASPLVAGVSALVKSRHPDWSPLWLKAAVMNTARHDVWTEPGHHGHRYAPARVGSGRVDAQAAVNTKSIAYTKGTNQPVSASFGVVQVPVDGGTVTKSKTLVVRNLSKHTETYKLSYEAVNPGTGVSYSVSPKTLKVPAHRARQAKVTMTVTPTALTHRIDPTMQAEQSTGFGDITRQFVADSSGRLLVTPRHKKALRVPVYGAAKPVSTTTTSVDGDQLTFNGAGVNQGTSMDDAYLSTASVMELGATSLRQPQCTATIRSHCWTNQSDRSGDIHYVGAGSGTIFGADNMVWFGISSWRDWATNNTMTPYVDIDVDGDGQPDLETIAQNFSSDQGRTDVFLVETIDYVTGELYDVEVANLYSDQVDTNVFDTNTIMLPIDLNSVVTNGGPDLNGPDTPITYWGALYNGYTGADQDRTDAIDYNIGAPDLREASGVGLLDDQDGETMTIEGSGKALVFHMFGAPGDRTEVVNVAPPPPGKSGSRH